MGTWPIQSVKTRPSWSRVMGLNPMTSVLIRREKRNTDMGGGPLVTEARIGVTRLQARKHQGGASRFLQDLPAPPQVGERPGTHYPSEPPGKNPPADTLSPAFCISELWENRLLCSEAPSGRYFVETAPGNSYAVLKSHMKVKCRLYVPWHSPSSKGSRTLMFSNQEARRERLP